MKEKKQKDPGKKKTARIVVGSIFGVFALFVLTVVMINLRKNTTMTMVCTVVGTNTVTNYYCQT